MFLLVNQSIGQTNESYNTVASYKIGAYQPSQTNYFNKIDIPKTINFLNSLTNHVNGDLISVDNLKWQKTEDGWIPFPNPRVPVYNPKKEDKNKYTQRYAKWINDHPHFELPPLPMD